MVGCAAAGRGVCAYARACPWASAVLWPWSSLSARAFSWAEPPRRWCCWPENGEQNTKAKTPGRCLRPPANEGAAIDITGSDDCSPSHCSFCMPPRLGGGPAPSCVRTELERAGGSQRLGALEHRRSADPADPVARAGGRADSVCPAAGGVSLPAPGAGHADRSQQPDADRAVAGADLFPDAAGRRCDI